MIELVVIGATLALAAGASGAQMHRRAVAARTLERYARSRGHRYVPMNEPLAKSPRVEGTNEGLDFVFEFYRLGGQIRTRASCIVTKGRTPKLSVFQRGAFARTFGRAADRARATAEPVIGHDAFDRAFRVKSATAEDLEALDDDVARSLVLLARRDDVWLQANGARVTLSWSGIETDPLLYDAARDVVCALASSRRSETPYR